MQVENLLNGNAYSDKLVINSLHSNAARPEATSNGMNGRAKQNNPQPIKNADTNFMLRLSKGSGDSTPASIVIPTTASTNINPAPPAPTQTPMRLPIIINPPPASKTIAANDSIIPRVVKYPSFCKLAK